jgi:hypothetical protein
MVQQIASMTGARRLADALRNDLVGGAALLAAAVIAVVWANSPGADAYESLREFKLGPLDLQHWAADGLLAVFFFVAGLELKQELTSGSLSRPADALVPTVAALGGMLVPAGLYVAVNLVAPSGTLDGWAIPMATDIAFALGVLAVVGRSLPNSLRAFLLTLAVVDDLGAIAVIADLLRRQPRRGGDGDRGRVPGALRRPAAPAGDHAVRLRAVGAGHLVVHARERRARHGRGSGARAAHAGLRRPGRGGVAARPAGAHGRTMVGGTGRPLFALLAAGVTISGAPTSSPTPWSSASQSAAAGQDRRRARRSVGRSPA